jgi:hypothetical protein
MITHNQAVRLLAFAAAYDQRTVGEYDADAWRMAGEQARWTYEAVQRVIVEHYAADADRPRITPAMVTDRLRSLRGRAAESFELPRLPDDLSDADYPAWLRAQLASHCDRILERWATAGDEPPRAIQAAPVVVGDLDQLVTRAPIQFRRAITAGVKAIKARRVRLDPVRREKAHAELDEARRRAATEDAG